MKQRLRASERNTKEISQMTLGCSSNKNELTTCTINGTVSQESTGPLECTVKVSGSLKHHWTALELKQGSTSTLWVSWENASQFLLIILKLSQVNKQNMEVTKLDPSSYNNNCSLNSHIIYLTIYEMWSIIPRLACFTHFLLVHWSALRF